MPPPLPTPLLIAYASWGECDDKVLQAIHHGANVIVWFSITLVSHLSAPHISGSFPDPACIAATANAHPSVLNLISLGGWNAPLPDTSHTGADYFAAFHAWNTQLINQHNWRGFDGIDWDVEGDDAGNNVFTEPLMRLVGEMSVAAKQASYYVTMAPAQSYLDVEEPRFDLSVTHTPVWNPGFAYHGRNLYAYWLAFYDSSFVDGESVPTFDWVGLQFYEGWSRMGVALGEGREFREYMSDVVRSMDNGWKVDFGERGVHMVRVKRDRLVIGVANGWAETYPPVGKFVLVLPGEMRTFWESDSVAGVLFWTIAEEGRKVNAERLFLVKSLANVMGLHEGNMGNGQCQTCSDVK